MINLGDRSVRINIEYLSFLRLWSWRVVIDGQMWGGFEYDYLNAERQASDILREQGVDE